MFEFASAADAARPLAPSYSLSELPVDPHQQASHQPPASLNRRASALEGQTIRGISTHSTALLSDFTACVGRAPDVSCVVVSLVG